LPVVEVDFGGGLIERIEISLSDDPVLVARGFCQAKGFSMTIALPLAVRLEQAKDKSRREARAARLGRPVNSKPAMLSTLTAKGKAEAKARLASLHAGAGRERPASARTRPPKLVYEKSKQFHSSATHVFDRTEIVFGARRPASAHVSSQRVVAGEVSARSLHVNASSRFVFGAGPGKQCKEKSQSEQTALRREEQRREREAKDREARLKGTGPVTKDSAVFDKLYGNAMRKKEKAEALATLKEAAQTAADAEARARRTKVMSRGSRELMQNRTAGDYASYNERLYAEGARRAQAREAAVQRAAEEKEREESLAGTGAPAISRYAKSLKRPDLAWDRLGEGFAEKFVVLAQIKSDMERKELAECTFRPKINQKSKTMMRGKTDALRDRGLSHHEQLYFDANRRQMRVEEYQAWRPSDHTFFPNAHRVVKQDDGDDDGHPDGHFKAPTVRHDLVVARLEASKARGDHEKKRLAEETYASLGVPSVGRPPSIDRNPHRLPIHDVLYLNRHEYDDKRELVRLRDEAGARSAAVSLKSGARSDGLVGALKRRAFRKMFAALDCGGSGIVDLKTADLTRLADIAEGKRSPGSSKADHEFGSVYNTPISAAGAASRAATPGSNSAAAARPDLGGFGGVPDGSPGSPGGVHTRPADFQIGGSPKLREMIQDVRSAALRCDGPVEVEGFIAAMEVVIAHDKHGPRGYLAPGQGRFSGARAGAKAAQAAAAARDRLGVERGLEKTAASASRTAKLALARERKLGVPVNAPIYEKLAAEGRARDLKVQKATQESELRKMNECTFSPRTHAQAGGVSVYDRMDHGDDARDEDGRGSISRTGSVGAPAPVVGTGKKNAMRALESLAAAVPTVSPTPGADKFAALEKELAALVSRAGNVSPLAALGQEESSDDDENNAF